MRSFIVGAGFYLFFLSITFYSCKSSGSGRDEVHPQLSLIVKDESKLIDISKKDIDLWEDHFRMNTDKILSMDISDEKYEIGSVTDVLIRKNELLILDNRLDQVHSIGFDGKVNDPVTIAGRGPGELTEPLNMMKLKSGYLIADRVNGIHYFDNKDQYVTTKHIKYLPLYVCQMGENYVIKTSYLTLNGENKPDTHTIFEIDEDSNILHKYSNRYNHNSYLLVFNITSGPLVCSESKGLVINSYYFSIPILELYFVRQGKSRIYHFTDLKPFKIKYVNETLEPAEENYGSTYHKFKAVNMLNDRFIVAQYSEVNRPSDPEEEYDTKTLSYIIDLDTNKYYYSYSLPPIKASSNNYLFLESSEKDNEYILSHFEIEKI